MIPGISLCPSCLTVFFPGILHCSLWDMSSQDNHIITHSCHQTWPSQWIPPSLDKSSLCSRSHQEISGPYSVTATLTFINRLQFPSTSPFVNPFINESTTEKHTDVPYTQGPADCSWPVMFCNASATSDGNGENWGAIPFLKVLLGQLWITMALISCSKSETEILISGRI